MRVRPRHPKLTVPVLIAVAVLIGLYLHGTFDRALYPLGLNFSECARNGFGASFCGHELDEYRARVEHVKVQAHEASEHVEQQARQEEAARATRATEEARTKREGLEAKLAREKAIVQHEPEGSIASDMAKDEYEYARAELQQLETR